MSNHDNFAEPFLVDALYLISKAHIFFSVRVVYTDG